MRTVAVRQQSGGPVVCRALVLGAVIAIIPIAGCGGGVGGGHSGSPGSSSSTSGVAAIRWWTNRAGKSGTAIDTAHPAAAAADLRSSRSDYCGMLRQTLGAGKSILPGVSAADPALLASGTAFVAELRKVAPNEVAGAWRVLGDAVLTLVRSQGDIGQVKRIDSAAVRRAGDTVAADAKHKCGVDLSAGH